MLQKTGLTASLGTCLKRLLPLAAPVLHVGPLYGLNRITGWFRLEGTSGGHLVQCPLLLLTWFYACMLEAFTAKPIILSTLYSQWRESGKFKVQIV